MAGEHAGHRQRLIRKFREGEIYEHELLEIMLYPFLPRRNTNDLAHRLLSKFGSISGVFSATEEELQCVEGIGKSMAENICIQGQINQRLLARKGSSFEGHYEMNAFLVYVKTIYEKIPAEVADLYFLDERGRVYQTWRFSDGEPYSVNVDPSEFSKKMLEGTPSGVVLVHNHPNGIAIASEMDDKLTKQFQVVCSIYGALLCDHIICAKNGVYSYYLSGKLQEISRNYHIMNVEENKENTNFEF